jgi:hypothetical protein
MNSSSSTSSSSSSSSIEKDNADQNNDKAKDIELQILRQTQNLVECLHSFGEGQSLEKRYLFHVVQLMFKDNTTNRQRSGTRYNNRDEDDEDDEEQSVDRLSKLFGLISKICKDQFEVISKVNIISCLLL